MYCWGAKKEYRKIPKISPRAYIFQRPLLRGLFLEGRFKVNRGVFALRVWGAYIWRDLYMEGLIFRILRYCLVFMVTKI